MANPMKKFFTWAKPLKYGVYHYRGGGMLEGHRVHLRIETNGSGLLVIDADKILYLNQTAAEIIKRLLDGSSDELIIKKMIERYRVKKEIITEDIDALKHSVKRFAEATDVDPITYLSDKDIAQFTAGFSAPHRMDLILTYDNSNLFRQFCIREREGINSINTEQWKRVIEILWNIGIPHLLFTGGEPTLFENFVELVQFAEEVGIVTGLLTNGETCADLKYTNALVDAGLDHLQITIGSHKREVHDQLIGEGTWEKTIRGLENVLATPLYCVVHTTFTKKNYTEIPQLISFLKQKGVYAIAADALEEGSVVKDEGLALAKNEVKSVIDTLRAITEKDNISFVWYGEGATEGADETSVVWEYSMCIEPDGDVTACECDYMSFGNILRDSWKTIWDKSVHYSKK